jgi:competence protein ComEA
MALLTLITLIVGGMAAKTALSASSPGITLRETFPQAPAAPPPVRPPVHALNAAPVPEPDTASQVVVHVAGAVKKPGVYRLPPGARGEDALKAAGGPTADANTDAINLAARVEDGSQLYFPTRKEQPEGGAALDTSSPAVPTGTSAPGGTRPASKPAHKGGKPGKLTDPSQGKINLNTAGAEELQRLPGVGPAMAARLLEFRKENGGFQSVEDLLQVSGIGDKKFARMRPFVMVGSGGKGSHK